MSEYKEMYLKLFNEMTDIQKIAEDMTLKASEIIYRIKQTQASAEEIYITSGREKEADAD